MPRPPRVHVPDGFYHVVLRGNHREVLFGSSVDRQALNDIVADAVRQHTARVHGFCWMSNHLHALLHFCRLQTRLWERLCSASASATFISLSYHQCWFD